MNRIARILLYVISFFVINYLLIFIFEGVDPYNHMGDYEWTLIVSVVSSLIITNIIVSRIFRSKKKK